MPKRARIHFVSLRSSLVNLPISIYGPLVERSVRPQHLAVHLTLVADGAKKSSQERKEAYVGWTGMASASSLAHFNAGQSSEGGFETVEIDPQYGQGLGFAQGDIVEIGLLHDLPPAKTVGTEPLTSDDWEIIEIHASHVESTLLSQVRVAKVGQEIDVWVLGRTRVRLRVTSVDPPTKGNASLLTTNTEVSIAPKLHRRKDKEPPKSVSNGHATTKGIAKATEQNAEKGSQKTSSNALSSVLRVLPSKLVENLEAFDHDGPELLAVVSPRTLKTLRSEHAKSTIELAGAFYRGTYKVLSGPANPSSTSMTPETEPSAKFLNPGSQPSQSSGLEKTPSSQNEIFIGAMNNIPEGHIVYYALPEGVAEWDLARVSLSLDDDHLVAKGAVQSKTASSTSRPPNFLAGVDDLLERGKKYCIREMYMHSMVQSVHGLSGLLVTGRSGAGKTSIVQSIAKAIQEDPRTLSYTHYVDASKLAEQPVSAVKAQFNFWFDTCAWRRPSVLILDNLDKLLSAEVEHADSFRSRHLTELFLRLFSSTARSASLNCKGIVLLATADSPTSLHSSINSSHIFKEVVQVKPPNKDARRDILSRLVQDRLAEAKDIIQDPDAPINFAELSTQTEGYSATDLKDLVSRAMHQVAMKTNGLSPPTKLRLSQADFAAAQVGFVPLSLRDVKLEKSDVAWSDIGGLYETRRMLRETLEWPTKYGPIFKQSPLRLRSGLLLYGYPGCGKTLLASAVAKECGLNFISVKGPEILNKYIGASEKSVRDLFERASAAKPCVLFFDEFDSIAPKRGHDSTGVTDRVVNQMLTQMDGAEGLDGVYVLAATSRPDLIDSALLRPGRLDKSLLCNIPDFDERVDILKAVSKKMTVSPTVNFDEIAEKTKGFSGADLQALLYNAHLDVIHNSISETSNAPSAGKQKDDEMPLRYTTLGGSSNGTVLSKAEEMALQRRLRRILVNSASNKGSLQSGNKVGPEKKKDEIRQADILKAIKSTRPSVSAEERLRLSRIYQDFISDRSGNLPVPPDAGGIGHRATLG